MTTREVYFEDGPLAGQVHHESTETTTITVQYQPPPIPATYENPDDEPLPVQEIVYRIDDHGPGIGLARVVRHHDRPIKD